jgi:predicted ATPase
MTKGYAAPEVEQTYARARALCQELGESPQLLPALAGLFRFYFVRAEFQTARELGAQVLRLAQRTSDAVVFLIAHSILAVPLLSLGEFTAAREQFEKGIALYDPQQHRFMASLYGDDPGIICLALSALTLWFLGYPAQALRNSQKALALAQDLALPYNLALALDLATWVHFYRGERQAAQACIEALLPLVSEQGFEFFAAESLILRGWVLAEQGQGTEGLMQMRPGLAAYRATGAEMSRPSHLGLLAKAYGKVGQVGEGLGALAEAFAVVDKTGECCLEAELYRLKGELTLRQFHVSGSKPHVPTNQKAKGKKTRRRLASSVQRLESEAEECFYRAIEIARQQNAKSLELRVVMSLARLWQQQGKKAEAWQLLTEIYGWFTEGFDTKDLQEAKALLEELA